MSDPWLLYGRRKILKGSKSEESSSSWLSRRLVATAQDVEEGEGGNDCDE